VILSVQKVMNRRRHTGFVPPTVFLVHSLSQAIITEKEGSLKERFAELVHSSPMVTEAAAFLMATGRVGYDRYSHDFLPASPNGHGTVCGWISRSVMTG
jgi:hypothetical protein